MPRAYLQNLRSKFSKLSSHELSMFARELSFLLGAGVPLLNSLTIIERQVRSKRLKVLITNIVASVSSGMPLSAALKREGGMFPDLFVNIVAAGEESGVLDVSLMKIASHYGSRDELKKKIVSATIYPVLVLALSIVSILFIAIYLIPTMNGVFSSLGIQSPLLTRVIASFGDLLVSYWHMALLLICTASFSLRKCLRDRILNMPIMGKIFHKLICGRISGTLGTLLSSGVPLIRSLAVASAVAGNETYRSALEAVMDEVKEGEKLSGSLKRSGVFPGSFCELVSLGEETGRLDAVFIELEGYYEREAASEIKVMTSLIEPLSTILVGAAVAAIVFSIFIPLMSVVDALAK